MALDLVEPDTTPIAIIDRQGETEWAQPDQVAGTIPQRLIRGSNNLVSVLCTTTGLGMKRPKF